MLQTKSRLPSLYNPAMQPPDEIVANFVIRLKEFDELFRAIKTDNMKKPPQHFMIQGQRGYGKSTLLLRLKIEIENDQELRGWLIPVMFDEEQYGILNLARLWEEVIEILADHDKSFMPLIQKIDALYDTKNPEEEIYKLLTEDLKKRKKKLVLFLDNFGDMIGKFTRKENQRLREILITSNQIRLVGASSTILEFYYDYKEPFFDFFKVITLNELDRKETIALLEKLGETYKVDAIKKIINEQPERVDSLRRLTGGVPRTVVLLFEIFADDIDGNSFKDLETTLDRVTPLYKHRLDNLSTQQQAIIDAIAQNWDAASTKEIAAKVRMPSKAVSAQLNQLEKNQLIKKISTSTKNHLYQVSERFFNIYYLMRLGKRRNRNRVLWLVKFFEICCGKKELIERAKKHIQAMREERLYDKHAFYISQALSKTRIPYELQHKLLGETKEYLNKKQSEFVNDLNRSHIDVLREVTEYVKNKDIKKAKKILEDDGFSESELNILIANYLEGENDLIGAVESYKNAKQFNSVKSMNNLGQLYEELQDITKAEKYYKMAAEKGLDWAMDNLGQLYQNKIKNFEKAEYYYKMAAEKGLDWAMDNLGQLYEELQDITKAEKYYKMAAEKGLDWAMNNLGQLYQTKIKDLEKAEEYYKMAAEKGLDWAMNNLGQLYEELQDITKAEKYYKMAAEKDNTKAISNLASLYLRLKKNKKEALQLQKHTYEKEKNAVTTDGYLTILLWNDEIQEAVKLYEVYFNTDEVQRNPNAETIHALVMFIAKKQYSFVYKLFNENKYDFKDKYKPIYYALLSLMGEKYVDELKKMGDELKESFQDVLNEITRIENDFA